MKIINEKGLALYAGSGAPADKEGSLLKKGELNKGFQKRWFVLKGNLLFYYDKKGDREPVGVIVLEGCRIELAENSDNFTFQIVFSPAGCRTYVISAETQEFMESWMKALSCAGYDYVKLMVADLQSRLSELSTETVQSLIHDASRESKMISNSYDNPLAGSLKISKPVTKRKNPFNSMKNMTLETGFNFNSGTELAEEDAHCTGTGNSSNSATLTKISRTFQQMHEEIGKQFEMFSNDWKNKTDVNSNFN